MSGALVNDVPGMKYGVLLTLGVIDRDIAAKYHRHDCPLRARESLAKVHSLTLVSAKTLYHDP